MFQHLPVNEEVISDGKIYKNVNRLQNGYITQVLANVHIDEIVKMAGQLCMKVLYTEKTLKSDLLKKL